MNANIKFDPIMIDDFFQIIGYKYKIHTTKTNLSGAEKNVYSFSGGKKKFESKLFMRIIF